MTCCRWLAHRLPLAFTGDIGEDGVGHVAVEDNIILRKIHIKQ